MQEHSKQSGPPPSLPLPYVAQEVTRLALRVDSSSLRRNNCYCLHSRGRTVARSRAGASGTNRVALYSVESPKKEPGTGPRTSRLLRGHRTHPDMCMCEHMLTYGSVSVCVCSLCRFFSPCFIRASARLLHQLAVTESSMKRSGSDRIRQPVSLASAAFLLNCSASEL